MNPVQSRERAIMVYSANGDYIVIYDAEDIPDPLQLKKAVPGFANNGADLGLCTG